MSILTCPPHMLQSGANGQAIDYEWDGIADFWRPWT